MEFDYIVIGAGSSGLTFAALMEKKGFKVALLEAHSLPGGCSSYFEREGYTFDAGATTLSGLKENRPLFNLIKELDLPLNLTAIDPGIVSILPDKTIFRFKDQKKWRDELEKKFPGIDHEKFWGRLSDIEEKGWHLSSAFKNIPLRSIGAVSGFLKIDTLKALSSLPALFTSVASELRSLKINDSGYLSMLDELLFITAQNHMSETPLLMGAMGLSYPDDTYYATGGMKAFSEALAAKCSHIFYRHTVKKITPLDDGQSGFEVATSKQTIRGKKVVSTIPIWNHSELFDEKEVKAFFQRYPAPDPSSCWSAFMIYLTIPLNEKREGLYYQIHTDPIPHCETRSFFVSLSHPHDQERSINGRQVVTISTHTKSKEWMNLTKEDYQKKKEECAQFILNVLKEKFELKDEDLKNVMTGTPKTFIKYTHRFHGLVGGIPHSLKRNPIDFLVARSPLQNFYMLGDTQYPGQGIAAVVLGAQNLCEFLD
nr:NAD(P)/FAD-dependent oxidoreductase [Bacteriovorax sp. HI3]